ncbi:hypothetical protein, partial [Halorubrum sp. SP3]
MNVRKFVYKHTFPLHHWVVRNDMFDYYEDIKKFERKDRRAIRNFQRERVQKMVEYARENTEHYAKSLSDVD